MDQVLYHPTLGFYASGKTRTGKEGDFLTPVSPGPVLGELLARQAEDLHQALGHPPRLNLIEQGADAGWLARDLLTTIQNHHPRLATSVHMHIVEPHPLLEEKQRQTLREAGIEKSVQWISSWAAFPKSPAPCFFYSCELVDSFPVKILQFIDGSWHEKRVGAEGSRLVWQNGRIEAETQVQIRHWNPPPVEGYTMELRPGAQPWVHGWAEKIPSGMVLTLDYGFPSAQLFSPARNHGTLVAIKHHQRVLDPLADPGPMDLTAHVNFTELEELAEEMGFQNYGLTDLARGLTALATPLLREGREFSETWIRNFRHLTHPSFLGRSHQILVQGKSLPASFTPSILAKL